MVKYNSGIQKMTIFLQHSHKLVHFCYQFKKNCIIFCSIHPAVVQQIKN